MYTHLNAKSPTDISEKIWNGLLWGFYFWGKTRNNSLSVSKKNLHLSSAIPTISAFSPQTEHISRLLFWWNAAACSSFLCSTFSDVTSPDIVRIPNASTREITRTDWICVFMITIRVHFSFTSILQTPNTLLFKNILWRFPATRGPTSQVTLKLGKGTERLL